MNLTLKHSLPPLFADSQGKVLQAVATVIGKHNLALLVLDSAHWILSHSFMLTGIGQTNKGLLFILQVLRESAQDPSAIDIASVARSCLINLLGEMVVCLGDEDPDEVDAVRISVFSFYRSKLLRLRRRTRGYANSFDFWAHQTPRLRDPRKKLRRSSRNTCSASSRHSTICCRRFTEGRLLR